MNPKLPVGCTLLVLLSTPVGSCSRSNPLYCDRDTPCLVDGKDFCDVDRVFPATTLENECIARPSPEACNRAQPCEDPDNPVCSDASNGVCVQCTESSHCDELGLAYCDPRSNACTDDLIVACEPGVAGDSACLAASEGTLPYCSDDAVCVACVDNEHCQSDLTRAVCDDRSFSCRPCESNGECDSLLCDDGVCADLATVVYVDATDGTDGGGCGSLEEPCASLTFGLAQSSSTRNTVRLATGIYEQRVELANMIVRIVGDDSSSDARAVVRSDLADSQPLLLVTGSSQASVEHIDLQVLDAPDTAQIVQCNSGGAALALRDVLLSSSTGDAVVSDNCALSVEDSSIRDNAGVGLKIDGGTLNLLRSTILANRGGGIDIRSANYSLVNNIIAKNGGTNTLFGGVRLESTLLRSEEFRFNTIAQNSRSASSVAGSALRCEATAVVVTSNLFMLANGASGPLVTGCPAEFSLFDSDDAMPGGSGNISGHAIFIDAANDDFHLDPESPGIDVADPSTDIDTDFDGEDRPQGDGPDMGADEVR